MAESHLLQHFVVGRGSTGRQVAYGTTCELGKCSTSFMAEGDGFWNPIYDTDGSGPGEKSRGVRLFGFCPFCGVSILMIRTDKLHSRAAPCIFASAVFFALILAAVWNENRATQCGRGIISRTRFPQGLEALWVNGAFWIVDDDEQLVRLAPGTQVSRTTAEKHRVHRVIGYMVTDQTLRVGVEFEDQERRLMAFRKVGRQQTPFVVSSELESGGGWDDVTSSPSWVPTGVDDCGATSFLRGVLVFLVLCFSLAIFLALARSRVVLAARSSGTLRRSDLDPQNRTGC